MDKISILPSDGEHDDAPVLLNGEPLGSRIVPYETDTKNDSTASESKIFKSKFNQAVVWIDR